MLHYAKVMEALHTIKSELFTDNAHEIARAREAWQQIVNDPTFSQKAHTLTTPWVIPSWTEPLDQTYTIEPVNAYTAISVDGSQIYPDKHQGTSCYLINIGTVQLGYGDMHEQPFTSNSIPYVYSGRTQQELDDNPMDIVNARRQELELQIGLELCKQKASDVPLLFLFDGSLIFWHLSSKSDHIKDYYISRYLGLMHELYAHNILHGGYISLTKGKDLVNLIRIQLCEFNINGCSEHKIMDYISDNSVANFFLEPEQRTIVFKSHAPITEEYPEHLQPYFFYMHVGHEVARIEIPAWIAQDNHKVDAVAHMMCDQAKKGAGYPVALAEAHEQAVVKGPDRDFFYQMVNKLAVDDKRRILISQKSAKKRKMGI